MRADRRRGARAVALLTALAAGAGACGTGGPLRGFASDQSKVEMVTTMVGGKNVFVPSTVVVTAGAARSLSIYNTTDKPHGFAIAGLGIEVVLLPEQETLVELPELRGGRVHRIHCHLHPPHRGGTLVVLRGR